MKIKLFITFFAITFIEALLFTIAINETVLFLFPGVFVLIDGMTATSLIICIIISAIPYLIGGLVLTFVYTILQKKISMPAAFIITTLIPLLYLTAISYTKFQNSHTGDTPADCAQLDLSEKDWCYRVIYQKHPTADVCSQLKDINGEAMDCWQLCKLAGNKNCLSI